MSPLFQASFDQNNTQPDNDIYVNNTRDVSKENDNSDIDYSKDENDENTINTDDQLSESEITIFGELYKIIEKKNKTKETTQHLSRSDLSEKVQQKIEKHQDALAQTSRTATYWIQYLRYIDILKLFIWAPRTENWEGGPSPWTKQDAGYLIYLLLPGI